MTNTDLLKQLITKSGLKLKYIAECLNISIQTLQRKVENQSEFKASEIKLLCEILNIESFDLEKKVFFYAKM